MDPAFATPSAQVKWRNEALSCHAGGLRWVKAGQVRDEPWDTVLGVATRDVTAKLYGFEISRWMHLSIELRDHTWIRVVSRDAGAFECAAIALRHAMPLIARRLAGELAAGREVSFGDVRLGPTTLRVRGTSWPLDKLAGYRAYQGTWMLDVGPRETPSLKAMVNLGRFANYKAFCMLLDQLRPGLDYGPDPVDRGTVMRPSASSHDPRYVSGRTRVLFFGGFVAVAALVGIGFVVVEEISSHGYREQRERGRDEARKLFGELAGIAASETAPFACTGPLQDGADNGQLVGALGAAPGASGLPSGLPVVLESGPTGLLLSDTVPIENARYIVLGEVIAATAAKGRTPGSTRIALRVTDKASGTVVCRGVSERVLVPDTYASSDARYADIDLLHRLKDAAVHPICGAGGPELCKMTRIEAPPPPAEPVAPAPAKPEPVTTKKKKKPR